MLIAALRSPIQSLNRSATRLPRCSGNRTTEIGKHEGLPKNYVSWLIRLAFLAPEIVEAIIRGNHPPDLTAQTLITPSRMRKNDEFSARQYIME